MNKPYFNEEKINILAQIQDSLNSLDPYATNDQIDEIINQIPPNYLSDKNDLKIICEIFGIYARNRYKSKKMNSIRLFEKIMDLIKKLLPNESAFFWNIFGGLFYFKLWMFNEGLISIDTIIQSIKRFHSKSTIEYFLPELVEYSSEIFEKELKHQYTSPFTKESLNDLKELRRKHFEWIRNSGDFNDPSYLEIEKNQLRLSIKKDDFESFQKILSNSNISINSKIEESIIERFFKHSNEMTLIEYALEYDAIKIVKFLILNNVELPTGVVQSAINSNNYEMIHLVETKMKDKFAQYSLCQAIAIWDDDVTEYVLNNVDTYNFLIQDNEKSDEEIKSNSDDDKSTCILDVFQSTIYYLNFKFLQSTIIPFFQKNPKIFEKNLYEIMYLTFSEQSCFFTKSISQVIPDFDFNYFSENNHKSFLGEAIDEDNINAVSFLINSKNVDVNAPVYNRFPALTFACGNHSNIEVFKLLCNHPKININLKDKVYNVNAFSISMSRGNFYSASYLIEKYGKEIEEISYTVLFFFTLKQHFLMSLKILLKFYLIDHMDEQCDKITEVIKKNYSSSDDYSDQLLDDFRIVFNEVKELYNK